MTVFRTNTIAGLLIEPNLEGNLIIVSNNTPVLRLEPTGILNLASSRFIVPVGNTATRSNVVGAFRFNTQIGVFETFTGNAWANTSIVKLDLQYLVVGGGGGSIATTTANYASGGGGAGGVLAGNLQLVSGTSYNVTIGAGGAAAANGSVSVFGPIFTIGGGRGGLGGGTTVDSVLRYGVPGGSGGGGGCNNSPAAAPVFSPGGTGISGQGFSGGAGSPRLGVSGNQNGGGGGGAGAAGADGSPSGGGAGGNGFTSSITGSSVTYAGGGGGGGGPGEIQAPGGTGGGGAGGIYPGTGADATGYGSGGGGSNAPTGAGAGSAGIVIIAYPNTSPAISISGGLSYSTDTTSRPGFIIHSFTGGTGTVNW